jgi:hypothetical protein
MIMGTNLMKRITGKKKNRTIRSILKRSKIMREMVYPIN